MNYTADKATIRTMAASYGFDLCHFSRPAFPDKHRSGLDGWLDAGMHGEMGYMAEAGRRERRKEPASLLPDVRSVITIAMRYTPPTRSLGEAITAREQGIIAAYALGDDYHEVMKKRLKALAAELDALLGLHDQRIFIDTAPVLEHALAEQSGLGWQGKHTLTIHRDLGSWLLLGEIFTTAMFEPDPPASFHCGSCHRCLDICPTQAIVAPFVVDARLCISYLTIEFGGFIPRELRPLLGNRIFGCDDCQAICPWNRHAAPPEPDLLAPRGENILPGLASLMALDEAGFRERFRKSPVKRTGRAGLLRNVAIAMGNSGETRFVQPLLAALNDAEHLIRGHAAWALAQLLSSDHAKVIAGALQEALAKETNAEAAAEMRLSIAKTSKDMK